MTSFVCNIDESGNGGPVFVAGGLTAKAENWLAFIDEWQARVLDQAPKIPFFKFSNVHQLSVTEHAKKISSGIRLINTHVARGDAAIIETAEYQTYLSGLLGATFDSPNHLAFVQLMRLSALNLPENGVLDFVFDDMDDTAFLEILGAHRQLKKSCPQIIVRDRLNSEPVRRTDDVWIPLQAADLCAGILRASYEEDENAISLFQEMKLPGSTIIFNGDTLPKLLSFHVQHIPEFTSGKYNESKKARSKRLGPARKALKNSNVLKK